MGDKLVGCRTKKVNIPDISADAPVPSVYLWYLSCPLRPTQISFYTWLHLFRCHSSSESNLYDWVIKAAAKAGIKEDLMDTFLLGCELAGEIAVASGCKQPGAGIGYYVQWAVLHIPHRSVEDLKEFCQTI